MASKTQTQEITAAAQLNNAGGIPVFGTFREFYTFIEDMDCDTRQGSAQTEISPEIWEKRAHFIVNLSQKHAYLQCLYWAAHDTPLATQACMHAIGCKVEIDGHEKCSELSEELRGAIQENNKNKGQITDKRYKESCEAMFPER